MADVLYLAHRMPFPPDKGDKISTYNFLRHLARNHRVHLGSFVDDPADWAHEKLAREWCAGVKLIGIDPKWRKLASARGLLTGRSLTEVYYHSNELQAWVHQVMREHRPQAVFAYSSSMAPYMVGPAFAGVRRLAHFTDVDSAKWTTFADKHGGPVGWVYGREGRTLLALERAMAREVEATSFISQAEVELFGRLAPESKDRLHILPNGVDTDYWNPDLPEVRDANPYVAGTPTIAFTGAMDYWPNADAVVWFADEVLPIVRRDMPEAQLWVVGSKPAPQVVKLGERAGIHVTGRVPDVRPYIAHAGAMIAPLRVARGTQNKVLEAYAMARPVQLTSAAANGLKPHPMIADRTHDEPAALAAAVVQALRQPPRLDEARSYVIDHFSWAYAFRLLDGMLGL